jgi:urea transporter
MALSAKLEDLASLWGRLTQRNPVISFVDTLLRGCGQVMFQNNPLTGLLILVGIFVNSALLGLAGLIGLIASTLTAMFLGADRSMIRAGLFGFNGILVGIAISFFLNWNPLMIVYIVIAGMLSAVVMMALVNLMSSWDAPTLTAPFVLTAWLFLFAVFQFTYLTHTPLIQPGLPHPGAAILTEIRPLQTNLVGAGLTARNLVEALFRGIGEVFFQDNLVTGIIFLIAILVNSRISALFALLGSLIGLLSARFLFGGDGFWIYHGLYGFNAVLSAIAIGGVFYVLTWESAIYALIAALVSTIAMASISILFLPLGMPALTAPFVLITWLFILPKVGFHILHPVALADVAKPEQTRHTFLESQHPAAGATGKAQPAS